MIVEMSAYEEDAGVVIAVVAAFVTVPVAADVITARSAKHAYQARDVNILLGLIMV